MISTTCNSLIEKSHIYHPTYGNGFSNHLPMSLVALDYMQASDHQLNNYYLKSISNLNLREINSRDQNFNFSKDDLGKRERFEDFFTFFKKRLKNISTEELLNEMIPILIKGVAGAAFHPLIRLSYALKSKSQDEIAISLAYWASEYLDLDNNPIQTDEKLESIRERLDRYTNHNSSLSNITDRIKVVNSAIKDSKSSTQPKKISLDSIREFALVEFAKADNFTLLHTVTACHAYKSISKYCQNNEESLRHFWHAILVAQLSTGITYIHTISKPPEINMEWPQILKLAVTSTDDHIIKLVYTCWDQNNHTPNTIYQYIAQRAVSQKL